MGKYRTFDTERLHLRPTTEVDADMILELFNTPKWIQFIGDRNVHSLEDAATYIQNRMMPQLAKLGFSNYTVIRKEDGIKLGSCGLYTRDGLTDVDIGFAFLPQHERKGYGFESASCLRDAGFKLFNIPKIVAITEVENIASQGLIEKLGLTFTKMVKLPNEVVDLMLYELPNPHL